MRSVSQSFVSSLHSVLRRGKRYAIKLHGGNRHSRLKVFHQQETRELSSDEVRAFMRHDAHRIEKAFYNNIFLKKRAFYEGRRKNVLDAVSLIKQRGEDLSEPTVVWAKELAELFEHIPTEYIEKKSSKAKPIDLSAADAMLTLMSQRRSSRVWSGSQPTAEELQAFAVKMIDAGRWAPSSGDRQPVRFKILTNSADKRLLAGLKEEHCYDAPCLIFVGADRRFYGGLGENEAALHVDAGSAAMQLVLVAHAAHFGVCWNHFSTDLIRSREQNIKIYANFCEKLKIPEHVEPVAVIAFGVVESYPPVPARMEVASYIL